MYTERLNSTINSDRTRSMHRPWRHLVDSRKYWAVKILEGLWRNPTARCVVLPSTTAVFKVSWRQVSRILWTSDSQASSFGVAPERLVRNQYPHTRAEGMCRVELTEWARGSEGLSLEHSFTCWASTHWCVPAVGCVLGKWSWVVTSILGQREWIEAQRNSSDQAGMKEIVSQGRAVTLRRKKKNCSAGRKGIHIYNTLRRLKFSAGRGIALSQPFSPYYRKFQKGWCSFCCHCNFWWMERIYIATPFAKESKVISLFGSLCSGIAFSIEGVFSLKEKDHDEGGSTIMFLQLFSAYCWTPARYWSIILELYVKGSRCCFRPLPLISF